MKVLGVLDRYVLRQWLATFILSAIGVPAVAVLIRLADTFGTLTNRKVPVKDIFLGHLFGFPPQMAILLPAAVLFATVFTLNALGRHSELTAVKAGGVSFFRLILPMMVLATLAVPVNFGLQELAATSSARQRELFKEKISYVVNNRPNAVYASESRWVYGAPMIRRDPGLMERVMLDLPARNGAPEIMVTADSANWWPTKHHWMMHNGRLQLRVRGEGAAPLFTFERLVIPQLNEPPASLIDERKKAEEMQYGEFVQYLERLKRASIKPGQLEVDLYLKIALPVACLVVALFGAPLAVTSPRSGAAFGLAMALGTTLVYLTGTQIMKAIGGKGYIAPIEAAWSMNAFFFVLAIILLFRVRS